MTFWCNFFAVMLSVIVLSAKALKGGLSHIKAKNQSFSSFVQVHNHFPDFETDPVMMECLEKFESILEREKMNGQLRMLNFACAEKVILTIIHEFLRLRPARFDGIQQ